MIIGKHSFIRLYQDCAITPEKNFKVDDIDTYLGQLTSLYFNDAQYIKHSLNLTIKVQLESISLEVKVDNPILMTTKYMENYNYCVIKNDYFLDDGINPFGRGNNVYYFIIDKKWVSNETIELTLKMDTLNTLKSYVNIDDKSFIIRQHKNRWKKSSDPTLFLPVIDMYSENIKPVLFKTDESDLYQEENNEYVQGSWYLIYRSHTSDKDAPIDILLCGDSEISVDVSSAGGFSGNFNYSNDRDAGYDPGYVIYGNENNVGATFTFQHWISRKEYVMRTLTITATNQCIVWLHKRIYFGTINTSGFTPTSYFIYTSIANKSFTEAELTGVRQMRQDLPNSVLITNASINNLTTTMVENMHINSKIANYVGERGTIQPISFVDRTDPLLLKIIKLPYRPLYLDFDANGVLTRIPNGWAYEGTLADFPHMLKYVSDNTTNALSHELFLYGENSNYESPYEILEYETQSDRGHLIARNSKYETKLLHSDFFLQKFVYDSFDFPFRAEFMETDGGAQTLSAIFSVSLTMSSKFMFQFPLTTFNSGLKLDTQDYSGMLYIVRNNELPIYNSAYLNYIRTGYNYDIKTRNRQLRSSIIGGTLSIAGAIGSFATAGITGGLSIPVGVSLLTTATGSFYNAISQTAQHDQNIAERLRNAEMQGLSVAGSDDVDLMSIYTNDNKAKLVKYEVSEKMKKALFDLFYYCGYVAGYQGTPDETSRKVFNFVQADIIFQTLNRNIPQPLLEDYKEKYHNGITILHYYTLIGENNLAVRGWDFEQQYENWETTLN